MNREMLKNVMKAYGRDIDAHSSRAISVTLNNVDLHGLDLHNIDFSQVDFYAADLSGCNLSGCNFYDAHLARANLSGANLAYANFSDAVLNMADLENSILVSANLQRANLTKANLKGASLRKANLYIASLRMADLAGADLSDVDIRHTDFSFANLNEAKGISYLPFACPDHGSFIGFKKANGLIVMLEIPEDAKRLSAIGRKCRCDKAKVLAIQNLDGSTAPVDSIHSYHDMNFVYKVGETVSVPDFDENRWNECSTGIHFFINRQEAVMY